MTWALDLGTSNSSLARWDAAAERPRMQSLPAVSRQFDANDADDLGGPFVIPSATRIQRSPSKIVRALAEARCTRRLWWGRLARIGGDALGSPGAYGARDIVPSFKRALGESPLRTLVSLNGRAFSARDVAGHFLRELLRETRRETGERIRELVITTPVDAYESYRAELAGILHRLGVAKLRFLDEPVAAALGYGLTLDRERRVLVVDFGGGTLDLALVELCPALSGAGGCRVLAKSSAPLGGNSVDRWLLSRFCEALEYPLDTPHDAERAGFAALMLAEARRVKERIFFEERVRFEWMPPEELRCFEARLRGTAGTFEVTRSDVVDLLKTRGVYRCLTRSVDRVLGDAASQGLGAQHIDDVLLVGGSTLLPGVFSLFEARFGRHRVRAFQPFDAVAYGACTYAAGKLNQSDFIVHDYALRTFDAASGEPEYSVVVPRGTRFPSEAALWKRRLVPHCALGEPERTFKLVICEIGRAEQARTFGWDADGALHRLLPGGARAESELVVELNAACPTLGELSPPHLASDRRPRLEVSFGVNAERWLCATVVDLFTQRTLLNEAAVVRLL